MSNTKQKKPVVDSKETEPNEEVSAKKPSKGKNGNKKSQKKGGRDAERMENFRAKTSERTVKENREALFERLFFGFNNVNEPMKNINIQQIDRTIILPISTRSAGFIVRALTSKFHRLGIVTLDEAKELSGSLYRITLIQLSYKLEEAMILQHSRNLEVRAFEDISVTSEIRRAICQMGAHFCALVNYISAIGFTKTTSCSYLPRLPKTQTMSPYYIHYGSLRETVEMLSTDLVTSDTKKAFMERSPIPNAVWTCQRARRAVDGEEIPPVYNLANPNEIIPADYGMIQIREDIDIIAAAVEKVGRKYPKYVSTSGIDWRGVGSISQVVSCDPAEIRCSSFPIVGRIPSVDGEYTRFRSPEPISDPEAYMGVVYLLGECKDEHLEDRDVVNFRSKQSAKREIDLDYASVLQNLLN